jgi:hypothetical protein
MKKCIKCDVEIPQKRIEILPNTKTCVKCSEIQKKGGITVQLGEGDHTYNEVIIMEAEDLNNYNQYNNVLLENELELIDIDKDNDISIKNINLEEKTEDNIDDILENEEDLKPDKEENAEDEIFD